MHGVIRTYRVPDAADLARRLGEPRDSGVFDVPGVVAYYLLVRRRSLVSVTVCEDDGDAVVESAAREWRWIRDAAGSLAILAPAVVDGPITAVQHSTPEAPGPIPEALVSLPDTSYRQGDWG